MGQGTIQEVDEEELGPLYPPPPSFRGAARSQGRPMAQSIPQVRGGKVDFMGCSISFFKHPFTAIFLFTCDDAESNLIHHLVFNPLLIVFFGAKLYADAYALSMFHLQKYL